MTAAASIYSALAGAQWEDLRSPATAIPIRGQSGDPDDDADGTLLFDATAVEQCAVIYQMPHAWDRKNVRFHLHWSKATGTAGTVAWQERHRIFNNNDVAPDWSSWISATGISLATGADQKIRIASFPEWAMSGKRGSCMISVQVRRNATCTGLATGCDTFAGDARLWETDIHYRVVGLGSTTEVPSY